MTTSSFAWIDHRALANTSVVTLYLLTGERILGVVEHREPQSEQTSLEVH